MALCILLVDLRDGKSANRVIFSISDLASLRQGPHAATLRTDVTAHRSSPSSGFALAVLVAGALVFIPTAC